MKRLALVAVALSAFAVMTSSASADHNHSRRSDCHGPRYTYNYRLGYVPSYQPRVNTHYHRSPVYSQYRSPYSYPSYGYRSYYPGSSVNFGYSGPRASLYFGF